LHKFSSLNRYAALFFFFFVNYVPGEKSPRHAPETLLSGLLYPEIYAKTGFTR